MLPNGGQRWMGREAMTSCIVYATSSVVLNLLNKAVFSRQSLHFPWFTLAFQNLISTLIALIATSSGIAQSSVGFSRELTVEMIVPIMFFVVFLVSNAEALRHMSLPVLTVFKSLAPLGVTLFERFFFHDVVTKEVYFSMLLVGLSTLLTFVYDLEFSALGYTWAIVNVISNIGYLASLRFYVSDTFSNLDKTIHSNLLAVIPIIPVSVLMGEIPRVIFALRRTTLAFRIIYVCSGACTMVLSASSFWCLSATDGSTVSFVGGLNKIPIVLLGFWLFDTRISGMGWFGIGLGVLAGIIFVRNKSKCRVGRRQSMRLSKKTSRSDTNLEVLPEHSILVSSDDDQKH